MPIKFRYFRGLEDDMGLLPGIRICSLCGQPGRCFSLQRRGVSHELSQEERQGKIGCTNCLKRDRFGFNHVMRAGFVDEHGLMKFDEVGPKEHRVSVVAESGRTTIDGAPFVQPPQEQVSDEAVAELRRTPNFLSWQDIDWKVHHDDFMVYLGIWGPEDFEQIAGSGSGRDLFLEMVDADGLWPKGEEPIFGKNIVMFECLHCSTKSGIFDID